MKRILLTAAALALLGAAPAAAQFGGFGGGGGGYGGGGYGGGGYGGGGYDGGRRRDWDEDRPRRRRDWDEPRLERRVQMGNICYTARGSCRTRPAPVNTGCGCDIPGFGFKRGAVTAGGHGGH